MEIRKEIELPRMGGWQSWQSALELPANSSGALTLGWQPQFLHRSRAVMQLFPWKQPRSTPWVLLLQSQSCRLLSFPCRLVMCVGRCSRIVGPCLLVLGMLSVVASILLLFPGGSWQYLVDGHISRRAKIMPGTWGGGIMVSTVSCMASSNMHRARTKSKIGRPAFVPLCPHRPLSPSCRCCWQLSTSPLWDGDAPAAPTVAPVGT